MKLYHVSVKPAYREMYFPSFLHDNIGYCWQKDEEHVWFKFIQKDSDGKSYISSVSRFCWADVEIKPINLVDFEEITAEDLILTSQ